MRFCMPHWDKLRAAISERGLDDLISKDGKRAVRNLRSEIEDGLSIRNFDPLMAAHNAILANALDTPPNPMEMMTLKDDGEQWCPLCYLNEKDPARNNYDVWIDKAADEVARKADELRRAG